MWQEIVGKARKAYERHRRYTNLLHRFHVDHVTEKEREHPTIYFGFDSYDVEPNSK